MHTGFTKYNLIAFVPITDAARAKTFYQDKLGLHLVREELPFGLVFDVNGIMLRLAMNKEFTPLHGTILGWQVPDIRPALEQLAEAGVELQRFSSLTGAEGFWTAPTGAKVAWFKDPDGNLLSVSEHPESKQ